MVDPSDLVHLPALSSASLFYGEDREIPASRQYYASGLKLDMNAQASDYLFHDSSTTAHLVAKRALDILLSLLALAFLTPLLVLVAIAIKTTSAGDVFFVQDREGLNGRLFKTYKFRSMRADDGDRTGILQTTTGDTRVTDVGRFIRKTSIDELPQLLNILRGDMSFVGPRPHVPGMLAAGVPYRDLVSNYDARLLVRPGLTGWAQANGLRGSTEHAGDAIARIEHDLAYIQNFSFFLDLRIIWLTFCREFFTGSGY